MAHLHNESCPICLGSMRAGDGQAMYTVECSHTFHYSCIAYNVQHGNCTCPTCGSIWRNPPFINAFPTPLAPFYSTAPHPPNFSPLRRVLFADDDPLQSSPATTAASSSATPVQQGARMTVKAFPEYLALSKSDKSNSFAVLVGIQAPSLSPEASDRPADRAPVDLIAVLDVSGSMRGKKISLLKQAVEFVINNLGPNDRLSIIKFSTSAQRVTPLRRMNDTGREFTIRAVNNLSIEGSTNIIAGLRMAVEVLEQRREKNPVSSILLLSDGQDNANGYGQQFLRQLRLLPPCIRLNDIDAVNNANQTDTTPVHTFGFGSDHDATALHAIADGSHGTFSYIETIEVIQDAFAQCIGGLLSVVAQQLEIQVGSASPEVLIQSMSTGRHQNSVGISKQHGVIYVGDVYAEEEKQFLVYVSIPPADHGSLTTQLLEVKCSYKDPLSKQSIMSETVKVEIRRPAAEDLSDTDRQVCEEVNKEKHRISVAEGIAEAHAMAERGQLRQAQSLLQNQYMSLQMECANGYGGTSTGAHFEMLASEVNGIQQMMASERVYKDTGRAFTNSKMLGHGYQRASTQAAPGAPGGFSNSSYQTTLMQQMVKKSRVMRGCDDDDQGQQSAQTSNNSKP